MESFVDEIRNSRKLVGLKQSSKAVRNLLAKKVFVANDADSAVVLGLVELCIDLNIPVERSLSMDELGGVCGIDVGAAAVAILRD